MAVIKVRLDVLTTFQQIQAKTKLDTNAQMEQFFLIFNCTMEFFTSNASETILVNSLKNIMENSLNPDLEVVTGNSCSSNTDSSSGEINSNLTGITNRHQNFISTGVSSVSQDKDTRKHTETMGRCFSCPSEIRKCVLLNGGSLKTLVSKRKTSVLVKRREDGAWIKNRNTVMSRSNDSMNAEDTKTDSKVTGNSSSEKVSKNEDNISRACVLDKETVSEKSDAIKPSMDTQSNEDADMEKTPLYAVKHYKCQLCIKSFNSKSRLSVHVRAQHNDERENISSSAEMNRGNASSETSGSDMKLKTHENTHHSQTAISEDINKQKIECSDYDKTLSIETKFHTDKVKSSMADSFKCQKCPRSFNSHSGLWLHIDKSHSGKSFICSICKKALSDAPTLKRHMICHGDVKQFTCNECGRQFALKAYLRDHMRTHTGEKPYKCDICGRSFAQTGYLTVHKRLHTGERPYTCDVCGKQCSQAQHLKLHKRSHSGEKPYSCDLCEKRFTQVSNLQTHRRSHTGEKPFTCTACGKRFAQSSQLQTHFRTHTGVKPYKCEQCGQEFTQNVKLRAHLQRHQGVKDYLCSVCGKSFYSVHDMQKHKRTHMTDKPHKCDVCGKGFIEAGYLRAHRRVHTGEKPYICDICGKGFRLMAKLNKHKQTHTTVDVNQIAFQSQPSYSSADVSTAITFPPPPFAYISSAWERDMYPQEPPQL